jgi:RMI1, N-terminal helical domain
MTTASTVLLSRLQARLTQESFRVQTAWLEQCIQFLQSTSPLGSGAEETRLYPQIREQLLHSDLREVGMTSIGVTSMGDRSGGGAGLVPQSPTDVRQQQRIAPLPKGLYARLPGTHVLQVLARANIAQPHGTHEGRRNCVLSKRCGADGGVRCGGVCVCVCVYW